jgi:hypothetical protein
MRNQFQQEDVNKYRKFKKVDGATYRKVDPGPHCTWHGQRRLLHLLFNGGKSVINLSP